MIKIKLLKGETVMVLEREIEKFLEDGKEVIDMSFCYNNDESEYAIAILYEESRL